MSRRASAATRAAAALSLALGCLCPCAARAQRVAGRELDRQPAAPPEPAPADSTRAGRNGAPAADARVGPASGRGAGAPSAGSNVSGDSAEALVPSRFGRAGWSRATHAVREAMARAAVREARHDSIAVSAAASASGVGEPGTVADGATTSGDVTPPAPRSGLPPREPVPCVGQPVSDIVVLAQPPYANNGLLGRLGFVERAVRTLHATTRPDVVRRFLVINPGERCDELRRAESERILRAQPYLVDARITPYDDGQGGVLLEVETRDEFSAILEAAVRTAAPPVTRLRVGESNFMGAGVHASVEWADGGIGYRDGMGLQATHYQFLGRPWQMAVRALRRDVGGEWSLDLSHPFYTDLQRVAWRGSAGGRDDHLQLARPGAERGAPPGALFYQRRWADVGGIVRLGVPGRLSLFGASVSFEEASTADRFVQLTDTGIVAEDGAQLGFRPSERYPGQRATRLNALWGVRNVRFVRVTGFDALTGAQDVRRGFQVGTLLGRGVSLGASQRDDDIFVSADLYAGFGTPRAFAALEVEGEGRQDNDRNEWNGVVGSGRAAWYLVPDARHRLVTSIEYAGVWRPRIPMLLALGATDGGARGFRDGVAAGARRLVARAEYRLVMGRPFGLGDAGVATFVDAGRVWAGGAPFGVSTPMRASAGVGLLAAVPPRSRRLWRIDVAMPLQPEPGMGRVQLIFGNRDNTRTFWREPRDVHLGRERAVPASIFNWP